MASPDQHPQRILITGVSGFIGRHLALGLYGAGHEVFGLSRGPLPGRIPGVRSCIEADILDAKAVETACKGMDAVVHLAGVTEHKALMGDQDAARQVNLYGTKNVLDACKAAGVKRMLFPSSGKVYGRPASLPIDEEAPLQPLNFLGRLKKESEELVASFCQDNGIACTIVRIFNVYGPGQRSQFLIPTVLRQLDEKGDELLLGDITVKKDYLYIDDLVQAFLILLGREQGSREGISTFNIGSGTSSSASEIVDIIARILEKEIVVETADEKLRPAEHYEERANISKLAMLGWEPKVTLEEGLRLVIASRQEAE